MRGKRIIRLLQETGDKRKSSSIALKNLNRRITEMKNKNKDVQLQIEKYKKELKKMNATQFAKEWLRVTSWLKPSDKRDNGADGKQ